MRHLTSTLTTFSVLTAASFVVGAGQVQALSLYPETSCSTDNFTGTTACEGIYMGNDSNVIDSGSTLFGKTGWIELFKVEDNASSDGLFTLEEPGATGGTWSLDSTFDFSDYADVMFTLKGGDSFSAYLSDMSTKSGTWNTDDLLKGNGNPGPGLSHGSVWVREGGGTHTDIPEPATILGLAAVSLAARSLRRKSEEG